MVTSEEPKWIRNDPDIPKHIGKITGLNKFDSQFFGVTYHLACVLEPMGRKLLEHTYGAIFDSGIGLLFMQNLCTFIILKELEAYSTN